MPIQQLGSVFLPVSNLEQSIVFYTEILGLVCRGIEDWGDGSRGATLFCDPHPDHAALLTLAEMKGSIPVYERPVFNFKCISVPEMHADLKLRGCRVTELESWDSPWNHHVLFDVFDPDGHMINMIDMVPIKDVQAT
ncbi:VOC family protein [Paenibacillus eucommiae]|uniref:Catechol 2,3-dioxygenase-like lactoylglutathione lyase family enzyme n=1 Tax=Paenibacillus eucommiae TaxID=1355755 RepID=A0ABS4IZM6_9BACL|nr:VOC family protein [Paenibacillus eucommiae]MBP1993048.1 catechol 2,3-dioxygenase-like lactoylglutathione lyase family enzyme [Paenibacillus eucommiae]